MKSIRENLMRMLAVILAATMCLGTAEAAFATEADPEEAAPEIISSDQTDDPEEEDASEDQANDPEDEDVLEDRADATVEPDDGDSVLPDISEEADPAEDIDSESGYTDVGPDDYVADAVDTIAMVSSGSSTVDSGSTGKLKWTLSSDGVLTISGSGAMPDYSSYTSSPWYSYRYSISSIVISSGVTRIGDYAFCYADAESVSLPSGLLTIGNGAFCYCTELTEVTIPSSVTNIESGAFAYCYDISSITLGSKLQTVGQYAFQGTNITSITIPASVTTFNREACYGCESLTSYNVASGNTSYASAGGVLFNYKKTQLIRYPVGNTATSYSVPGTVTEIGNEAFYQAKYLKTITLTNKVKTIDDWAFDGCTALTSITIPDSVTSIAFGIFYGCTSLTKAVIGNGVTCLENETFFDCPSLSSVTLGNGIKSIDSRAFYNCTSLKTITLPSGLTSISNYSFYKCTGLTSVTIPSSVTYVGEDAFYECSSSLKVIYPSTLTKLDNGSYCLVDTVKLTGTCDYTMAYEVLDLVNKERKSAGLSSLTMDKDLLTAAMQRAAEINLNFSHTRPSGLSCFTVSSKASGENIAAGYASADSVMTGWMNSSGHKANILGSSYKSIGIGCFTQGGTVYWVQIFGTGSATKVSKPSNTKKTFSVALDPDTFTDCISLRISNSSIYTGKSTKCEVKIKNPGWGVYATADNSSFKFSSGSKTIATVSSSGKVKGKAPGKAKIKVKTSSGKLSDSVSVKVSLATPTISKVANTASGIKVRWKQVTGASGYYIYRKTGSNGSYKKIAAVKSGSTLSYTNKTRGSNKVSAGKTYYYKVVAYNGSKKSSRSTAVKTVCLTKPVVTSLKNSSSGKMSVQWHKKAGATGYQVQYATNKSFTHNKKTVTVTGKTTTKKTISKLKKGKTYYVRVRSYKKVGSKKYYSAWSTVKKIKIKK